MKKVLALIGVVALAAFAVSNANSDAVIQPAKISSSDVAGGIYARSDMLRTEEGGNTTLDVTSLLSSDGKFASGMYRSGKVRFDVTEPYGVDEFMYFVEGSVTLTSADGSKTLINAGEAVTIPKEWTGVWETDGYSKIWVIYSEDGSGL